MSTLERLLISDGDSRTAIDPDTGASKYLVPLGVADERLLSFASTTASPLSAAGLAAAAAADAAWRGPEEAAEEVGSRLRELLGLSSAVEVLLCASGTDGQLLALERAGAARVAVACAEESGSGAECAAQGLHFDGPLKGQPARGRSGPRPARLLRRGQPWESGEAEKEDEDEWLFAMECSKLASRSPLPAARRRLLVDACQLRLGRSRLAALLERGCLVVGTLSKFFCAPAFCGFVLLPPGLPPPSPPLPPPPPPMGRGLWLRFAVGLGVMADYYSLPAARRAQMLDLFVAAARARLVRSPACQLLEPEQQVSGQRSTLCFQLFFFPICRR